MRVCLRKTAASLICLAITTFCLASALCEYSRAQVQAQPVSQLQAKLVDTHETEGISTEGSANITPINGAATQPALPEGVLKELAAMKARIEQLELKLKENSKQDSTSAQPEEAFVSSSGRDALSAGSAAIVDQAAQQGRSAPQQLPGRGAS